MFLLYILYIQIFTQWILKLVYILVYIQSHFIASILDLFVTNRNLNKFICNISLPTLI